MDQVFQSSSEPQEQETPAQGAAPSPSQAGPAPQTGESPAPLMSNRKQVYVVGGISAAASFILVLLGYLLFGSAKPKPKPGPEPKPIPKTQTQVPELPPSLPTPPSQPTLPPPVEVATKPETKEETPGSPDPQPPAQASAEAQDFEAARAIPDSERDRKATAVKEFIAKYPGSILSARASNELEKLVGRAPEPPIQPAKKELQKKVSGLKGEYFSGRDLRNPITQQVDLQVCLDSKGIRPSGVPREEYSARWRGYLFIEKEGVYTIATVSDDGVRVRLNGRSIIDNWGDHGAIRDAKTLALKPGYYELLIEYYQGSGDGEITLRWSLKDGFDDRIITADNLFHERDN
jgi:hypothetical protein